MYTNLAKCESLLALDFCILHLAPCSLLVSSLALRRGPRCPRHTHSHGHPSWTPQHQRSRFCAQYCESLDPGAFDRSAIRSSWPAARSLQEVDVRQFSAYEEQQEHQTSLRRGKTRHRCIGGHAPFQHVNLAVPAPMSQMPGLAHKDCRRSPSARRTTE